MAVTRAEGELYRFESNGTVNTIERGIGIANTLAWSPELDRLYFADSLKGQLYVYDCELESGAVRNKRVLFETSDYGVPDGSAIDVDGCLWNARWDAGVILRITPSGGVDRVVSIPAPRPTSCAFGGADLRTLFVTSARLGLTSAQLARCPLSGSVFAIQGVGEGIGVPPLKVEAKYARIN